jgi:hypothetical protein
MAMIAIRILGRVLAGISGLPFYWSDGRRCRYSGVLIGIAKTHFLRNARRKPAKTFSASASDLEPDSPLIESNLGGQI